MSIERPPSFGAEYLDVTQHWSKHSEEYAGGDALVTMLSNGWELQPEVRIEDQFFAGMRSVSVYHLTLERNGDVINMPVLRNPYVNRIIRMGDYKIIESD